MKAMLAICAFAVVAAACGPTDKEVHGSQTTAVNLALPDATGTEMNAYHLTVTPKDAACPGATKIDVTADYSATKIEASLAQGCDYELVLSLGRKPTYADAKPAIEAKCGGCHAKFKNETEATGSLAGIKKRLAAGTMPPANDPQLTTAEKSTLQAWAEGRLGVTNYKNNTALVITKDEIEGKPTLSKGLTLQKQ